LLAADGRARTELLIRNRAGGAYGMTLSMILLSAWPHHRSRQKPTSVEKAKARHGLRGPAGTLSAQIEISARPLAGVGAIRRASPICGAELLFVDSARRRNRPARVDVAGEIPARIYSTHRAGSSQVRRFFAVTDDGHADSTS